MPPGVDGSTNAKFDTAQALSGTAHPAEEGLVKAASDATGGPEEVLYQSERTRVVRVHPADGSAPIIRKQPIGPRAADPWSTTLRRRIGRPF